jgi:redox-sensitive bicupin YhaK (pirin superfamily)
VHLKRAFGYSQVPQFDPFLMLDDFHTANPAEYLPGFPWHPHRGIETITYILEGLVEHGDSMGNKGVITPGDVQWMTAGSGIIHQEMPKPGPGGRMGGFQLWANLPAGQKMMDPRYRDIKAAAVPVVDAGAGVRIKVICGEVSGTKGPVQDVVIEPEYLDVSLPAGAAYVHPTALGHTLFAYVFEGEVAFGAGGVTRVANRHLAIFDDGDSLAMSAGDAPARLLLISGKPLREPVAWRGPIVMNTREELRTAFEEYENGTFIKKR